MNKTFYRTVGSVPCVLSLSFSLVLIAARVPRLNAQGLIDDVFLRFGPLSLRTQNANDIATQRNYGGPRTAGLIGSVCSACLLSGSQGGRNALAAAGFSQLGVTLPGLNSLSGGNQFFGQAPAPQTFFPSFQDPFAAGGAFAPAISNALGILGFGTGSASPFGFGSTFLSNLDPVFSGGFGLMASADSVRASWRRRSLVQTGRQCLCPGPALRPSYRY